eukprot:COSAG06_NODE_50856_length_315_cov_41.777778_1_plen_40_part_01
MLRKLESPWKAREYLESLEDEEPFLADCNVRGSASGTAAP